MDVRGYKVYKVDVRGYKVYAISYKVCVRGRKAKFMLECAKCTLECIKYTLECTAPVILPERVPNIYVRGDGKRYKYQHHGNVSSFLLWY